MHVLVVTETVHTTAAACDYLDSRRSDLDSVTVVAVVPPDEEPETRRDREEAVNVARVRLAGVDLETDTVTGPPAETILDAAADLDADELVVTADGSSRGQLLDDAAVPVVVLPEPVR